MTHTLRPLNDSNSGLTFARIPYLAESVQGAAVYDAADEELLTADTPPDTSPLLLRFMALSLALLTDLCASDPSFLPSLLPDTGMAGSPHSTLLSLAGAGLCAKLKRFLGTL